MAIVPGEAAEKHDTGHPALPSKIYDPKKIPADGDKDRQYTPLF
ncbi:MAG TPA: hypothetical protein VN670_04060 [Acidobacteriaceae bacterium]|nr:hypothetical protein [Acidobacteriaceae bacterium]